MSAISTIVSPSLLATFDRRARRFVLKALIRIQLYWLQFGGQDYSHDDMGCAELWKKMSHEEQQKLKEMSNDKNVAKNLTDSLFPNIYGHDEVRLSCMEE